MNQASQRAALQDDLAQRRLILEEKNQLIEIQKMGTYSTEVFVSMLAEIDSRYKAAAQLPPAKHRHLSDDSSSDIEVLYS
jgi:hypothetical protein